MDSDNTQAPGFDINKVTAEVITAELAAIKKAIGVRAAASIERAKEWFPVSAAKYLSESAVRVGRTRTLLSGHEAVPIKDFYVPLDVSFSNEKRVMANLKNLLSESRHVLLTGSGGSGKSMLMRSLFLEAVSMDYGFPVYYELRNINSKKDVDIIDAICRHMGIEKFNGSLPAFKKFMTHGKVLLLLDGFDELSAEQQESVQAQIDGIARWANGTRMVVSSRPSESLGGWANFGTAATRSVTLKKAISIVMRLNYDAEIADKFIKELKSGLFDRNSDLLSTPLMLIIMLLTFQDSAGVPSKQHLFYANALDALMRRHDATKTGYKRELRCKLDAADFNKLLSAFAYVTYYDGLFQFTMDNFQLSMSTASKLADIPVKTDDYHKDLLESVCLLVREGMNYIFVHRSFQEYFVAYFVIQASPDEQVDLIDKIMPRAGHDTVLRMIADMNQALVEQRYILPWIVEVRKALSEFKDGYERLHAFWDFLPVRLSRYVFTRPSADATAGTKNRQELSHDITYYLSAEIADPKLSKNVHMLNFLYDHYLVERMSNVRGVNQDTHIEFQNCIKELGLPEIGEHEYDAKQHSVRDQVLGLASEFIDSPEDIQIAEAYAPKVSRMCIRELLRLEDVILAKVINRGKALRELFR